ncbi:hypothetical protein N9X05_19120 [Paracoccaceae bacterium]|nr:hypothetical protein [Paracoccaceae bacterium]
MPVKRRSTKLRRHKISAEARAIFRTSKGEQITLFDSGAGLICNPKLARALNLLEYVCYPDMRALAEELSTPLTLDGDKHAGLTEVRK